MNKYLALLLIALLSLSAVVRADDSDDDDKDDYADNFAPSDSEAPTGEEAAAGAGGFPGAHSHVALTALFPDHLDGVLPAGESVDILVALRNGAGEALNVSAVFASLHDVNTRAYIQNYTLKQFEVAVPAGEEATVSYAFTPHPRLEPGEYSLSVIAFYADSKAKYFSDTAFNSTISLTESGLFMDSKSFVIVLIVIGIAAFFAISSLKKNKKTSNKAQADDSQWLKKRK